MDDGFEIPVSYKGKDLSFPAQLLAFGYTHRILVNVNGVDMQLEPDEERNYRAIVVDPEQAGAEKLEAGLIAAIVEVVESIVK
ncbi:MAG: hypothetical protein ACTHMC_28580 [Pseudobacter sp.]|uniref:hypothetical protein n=1 Tax=Pseudobacter sp. TaxID=2045420 RepID=UPI003F7F7D91